MKTVKVHLMDKKYTVKPEGKYGFISKIITRRATEIDIDALAEETSSGRAFTPAIFHGGRGVENFAQEQVFALDFDSGITVEEFLSRANQCQIPPAFVYATYSHSEEKPRFRAVFVHDCVIEDGKAASVILRMLHQIFPEADKNCAEVSRIYLGGKGLLYKNVDAEINLVDLALHMQEWTLEKDPKNYARNIKRFGKANGIRARDGVLMIRKAGEEERTQEARTDQRIFIGGGQDSPCYIIETEDKANVCRERAQSERNIRVIRDKTYQDIADACPLFRDFYEMDLPHQQKFFLATNLFHIKGGQKLFFDGLVDHQARWKIQWKYIKANGYGPEGCGKADCPNEAECGAKSLYHKLASRIKRVKEEEPYIDIDEAVRTLDAALKDALAQNDNGLYLIQAQTAIGKTTAYCNIARGWNGQKPLMIAVPTMDLQRQVEDDLRKCGVSPYLTPNKKESLLALGLEDLAEEAGRLYEAGFEDKVSLRIREYKKEHQKDMDAHTNKELEKLLQAHKKLDGGKCAVTTHAMLLSLPSETLRKYEIIVDEDILMTLFKNTGSVSFQELGYLLDNVALPSAVASRIRAILGMEDGSVGYTGLHGLENGCRDLLYEEGIFFDSPIPKFIGSAAFYVDAQEEQVHYFYEREIPDVKLTVVSATMNERLYANYCRGRRVHYVNVPLAQYKGKLVQYTAHSMSRSCIDNFGYDKVKEKILQITQNPDINWITFRKFGASGGIYFGKTEGFNHYQGHDLVVLGTPHNVPFLYALIGKCLGYRAEEKMSVSIAEHNGYSFPIMTFQDSDMRNLQFYFLESELEQAVGRARLLRRPCKVYLFSNFPCRQAELVQDDYMKGQNEESEKMR